MTNHHQRGASLIEVLVSLFVISVGAIGATQLQTSALRQGQFNYAFNQANLLANDLFERVRANQDQALTSSRYNLTFADTQSPLSRNCRNVTCSAQQMAEFDLHEWQGKLIDADYLPGAKAQVEVVQETLNNVRVAKISIKIRYQTSQDSSLTVANGQGVEELEFATRI